TIPLEGNMSMQAQSHPGSSITWSNAPTNRINFVPPTSMRLVGALLHVMLDPGCDCACMLILPSKGIVAELTDKPRASLVRDANDHLFDGAARFHVGDGVGRGFQWKDLVQDRLDDALFHQRS